MQIRMIFRILPFYLCQYLLHIWLCTLWSQTVHSRSYVSNWYLFFRSLIFWMIYPTWEKYIFSFSGYYGYYKIFRLLSTFNIVQGTIVFIIKTLILINTVTLSLQTKHRLWFCMFVINLVTTFSYNDLLIIKSYIIVSKQESQAVYL